MIVFPSRQLFRASANQQPRHHSAISSSGPRRRTFSPIQPTSHQGLKRPPHLQGSVERGRGEGVVVLGIEGDLHDVVSVAFENLSATPLFIPIPQFDGHIVAGHVKKKKRIQGIRKRNIQNTQSSGPGDVNLVWPEHIFRCFLVSLQEGLSIESVGQSICHDSDKINVMIHIMHSFNKIRGRIVGLMGHV